MRKMLLAAFIGCGGMLGGCVKDPLAEDVAWARGVRPMVEQQAVLQQQRAYRETGRTQQLLQLNAAEERKIPYSELMAYPPNWPDVSAVRDAETKQEAMRE